MSIPLLRLRLTVFGRKAAIKLFFFLFIVLILWRTVHRKIISKLEPTRSFGVVDYVIFRDKPKYEMKKKKTILSCSPRSRELLNVTLLFLTKPRRANLCVLFVFFVCSFFSIDLLPIIILERSRELGLAGKKSTTFSDLDGLYWNQNVAGLKDYD